MSHIPVRWSIDPKRSALIVVDMQGLFCDPEGAVHVPDCAAIIEPVACLSSAARQSGVKVVYLRHVVRGDGSDTGRMRDIYPGVDAILARANPSVEIVAPLRPKATDIVVDKLFYSGFHNTDLDTILRARDIDTVIICGTVTNVCCESTARDAVHREYKVVVVADACAAMPYPDMGWGPVSAADVHRVTLTAIAHEFGEVTICADIVARMECRS